MSLSTPHSKNPKSRGRRFTPPRIFYRTAYGLAVWTWRLFKIETRGALVAVWHGDDILLVKNSYRTALSLPGGLMGRHDRHDSQHTAQRELEEEVGITATLEALQFHSRDRRTFEGHICRTDFYELQLPAAPELLIDAKEIEAAYFLSREQALSRPLLPMVRDYLLAPQSPLDQRPIQP